MISANLERRRLLLSVSAEILHFVDCALLLSGFLARTLTFGLDAAFAGVAVPSFVESGPPRWHMVPSSHHFGVSLSCFKLPARFAWLTRPLTAVASTTAVPCKSKPLPTISSRTFCFRPGL